MMGQIWPQSCSLQSLVYGIQDLSSSHSQQTAELGLNEKEVCTLSMAPLMPSYSLAARSPLLPPLHLMYPFMLIPLPEPHSARSISQESTSPKIRNTCRYKG